MTSDRRTFMETMAKAGMLLGAGDLLTRLPSVAAEEAILEPDRVRFGTEIEPLVRFLEETPRDQLLEETGHRIRSGTSYREILAALMLAGVRNIQPRPVGFKFHAVLVVNSAHLASLNSPDSDRWLPIFWALDQFKSSQARDIAEGDWTMEAVREKALPPSDKAAEHFREAMDAWDEERSDEAIAALARSAGSQEIFDIFCHYGARDFRDIGHKAIYVANSWRTLQTIGWQHAEPILRSLAYALLFHRGDNPATGNARADLPGRENSKRLETIRPGWKGGHKLPETTTAMLASLRDEPWDAASQTAVDLLNGGSAPQALWDAFFQFAIDLLMRHPGILTLHACTSANALNYNFRHTSNDKTRRFLLLQTAAFLTLFRDDTRLERPPLIDTLEPITPDAKGSDAVEEIFTDLGSDRLKAAAKTFAYLDSGGDAQSFVAAAQRLIYLKGTNSHDYKFSSAILEDYLHLSPQYRNRFLAGSTSWLRSNTDRDSPLLARSRSALRGD